MNVLHVVLTLIIVAILIAMGGGLTCLPGDICYHGKRFTVAFPIVTWIVVSIVVAVVLRLFGIGGGK